MTRASVRILGGLLLMGAVLSSSSCATDPNTIYRSAIERALEGYAAVTEHIDGDAPQPDVLRALASGLRPVDLQGCPDDFRAAWLIHIQAAEAMAQFAESESDRSATIVLKGAFKVFSEGFGSGVDTFLSGVAADGERQEIVKNQFLASLSNLARIAKLHGVDTGYTGQ